MSRRSRRGWMTEIAFADVAMAMLGPILLLLVVFIVHSVRNETNSCGDLPAAEVAERAAEVRAWMESMRTGIRLDEERLRRDCPVARLAPADGPGVLPAAVAGLCGAPRSAVLRAAGTRETELLELDRRHRAALARVRSCLPPAPDEVVTIPEGQIRFASCRTEFVSPATGLPMTTEGIDQFFRGLISPSAPGIAGSDGKVQTFREKLLAGSFNRIDIFGHSDSVPIPQGASCEGAKDNPELSSLRAHAFRKALESAIRADQGMAKVAERLDRRELRIYAIGVGDAEKLRAGASNDENRRIELRFATDRRQTP